MSAKNTATKVSVKLKILATLRQHLTLSPEEYRLLVSHVVREHIAEKRRTGSKRARAAA